MPCIVRRTALSEGRHCQKDAFTRAAETDNALLVQVKQNQPTLQDTLARSAPGNSPSTATRPAASGSIGWSRSSTPAGHRVAAVDRLRVSRLTFEKDTRTGLSREEIGCYTCQI